MRQTLTKTRAGIVAGLAAVGVAALVAVASGQGTAKTPGNIWPPERKPTDKAVALSPEEEMKTFSLPPGYRVELVASEPMIESPILMDFDADGRLWVLEMLSFLPDTSGRDSREPINRVSVLEDTNGDGRMDKKTVFADKLLMPRALKVLDHGVLVGEPPNLWLMKDTNGDLKSPTPRTWSSTPTATPTAASSTTRTACSGRWTTSCTRPSTPGICGGRTASSSRCRR